MTKLGTANTFQPLLSLLILVSFLSVPFDWESKSYISSISKQAPLLSSCPISEKIVSPVLALSSEGPEAFYDCKFVSFQTNFVSLADKRAFNAEKKNYRYLYSSNPIDDLMKEFLKKEFGITNIEQIEDNWFQFIVTKS